MPCKMSVQVTQTLVMPNHLLQHQTTHRKEIISSPYFHVPTVYLVKQVIRYSQNGGNKPCTKLAMFFLNKVSKRSRSEVKVYIHVQMTASLNSCELVHE